MRDYAALGAAIALDLPEDPDRVVTSDTPAPVASSISLLKSILKKREDWPSEMLEQQSTTALNRFVQTNKRVGEWSWKPEGSWDEQLMNEVQYLLWKLLEPGDPTEAFDLAFIAEYGGQGPGAVVGGDSTTLFHKVAGSTLSATSDYLVSIYRSALCERPAYAEAEFARQNCFKTSIVAGSEFFTVPKNSETHRSCCKEPTVNMFIQKAIGAFIERRLDSCWGINLARQPDLNRTLAKEGSLNGAYGTIDLKDASDSMSLQMIEQVLPASTAKWVRLARSPSTVLPTGEVLELNMVSSMGNGFTFPLQTAVFGAIVLSVYRLMRIEPRKSKRDIWHKHVPGNWAVFGDDIIVVKEAYQATIRALALFGFIVNETKSFNTGGFRESCGEDWLNGINIRGVYIKSLKTVPEVYSAINRLVAFEVEHGLNLSHTLRLLLSWVPFLPVPDSAADHEGVKVPFDPHYVAHPRERVRSEQVTAAQAEVYQSVLYRKVDVLTRTISVPEECEPSFQVNPDGWYITWLGGYARTPSKKVTAVADRNGFNTWFWPTSSEMKSKNAVRRPCRPSPRPKIGLRAKPGEPTRWKVRLDYTSSWIGMAGLPDEGSRGGRWLAAAGRLEFLNSFSPIAAGA